jgi:DNA-binding XRE family transcriptional regulator
MNSLSHALSNLICLCQSCHLKEEARVQEKWGGQLMAPRPKKQLKAKKLKTEKLAKESRKLISLHRQSFVASNYLTMSQTKLASELGVSQVAISLIFKKLGIKVNKDDRRRLFL